MFCFCLIFKKKNFVFHFQFAHRDCIQRWCNEKGNTTCEIWFKFILRKHANSKKRARGDESRIRDNERFTVILLVRHFFDLLNGGTEDLPN
ncbi:uncharacterized protein LOC108986217 [Juglans regia]|uniref:Uncharacterized protein LOC108986217 n=1 Tax=Juglans regia TaxID=51240 RepID=A0A6P9EPR0_JUGRE|nr:uncharacterized protein LOC108986217 [Juglans regia]